MKSWSPARPPEKSNEPPGSYGQQTQWERQKRYQTALGSRDRTGFELLTNGFLHGPDDLSDIYRIYIEPASGTGVAILTMLRTTVTLAIQLLPAIVLVVIGWGFDDLPRFLLNPARAGLAALVLAAVVSAVLLRLDVQPLRTGSMPTGSQSLQLGLLVFLSLFLLWFLPFADRRRILTLKQDYWRYLGLLLCCIGVAVRVMALKKLGAYFSAYVTLQPNHRLVRNGIYASIRHPLYLSLLLAPCGAALVFRSLLALPILVLAIIFVSDRIRREEQLLAANFGSEFEEYQSRTWKLIPLLL